MWSFSSSFSDSTRSIILFIIQCNSRSLRHISQNNPIIAAQLHVCGPERCRRHAGMSPQIRWVPLPTGCSSVHLSLVHLRIVNRLSIVHGAGGLKAGSHLGCIRLTASVPFVSGKPGGRVRLAETDGSNGRPRRSANVCLPDRVSLQTDEMKRTSRGPFFVRLHSHPHPRHHHHPHHLPHDATTSPRP